MHYVYMIKDTYNKLYVGISQDAHKRTETHNTKCGAQFTKQGNFHLVFQEEYTTLSEARKREIQIKKWRREKKELLIKKYQNGLDTK